MDNSSYTFDYVAAGSSHLIHVGWLHPHPARLGDHRRIDPHYPRAQTGLTFRAILAIVRGKHSLLDYCYMQLQCAPSDIKYGCALVCLLRFFGVNPATQERT